MKCKQTKEIREEPIWVCKKCVERTIVVVGSEKVVGKDKVDAAAAVGD